MTDEIRFKREASGVTVETADGLLTRYRWNGHEALAKPVCYPIIAPDGRRVTRGYPLEPIEGDRVDHPHHVGFWLAYGDVNGTDFWNSTGSNAPGMGTIEHRSIERLEAGSPAVLETQANWTEPDGASLLAETTHYTFSLTSATATIDRITSLEALAAVELADDKEGLCGLRVHQALEHPTADAIETVAKGGTDRTASMSGQAGRTGEYHSNRGRTGGAVWGTRAEWVRLSGELQNRPIAVTLMDHPDNPGHPTYWHAREYGLFAANPLGQAVFSEGQQRLGLMLAEGETVTFRFRLRVDTSVPSPRSLDHSYKRFVEEAGKESQ